MTPLYVVLGVVLVLQVLGLLVLVMNVVQVWQLMGLVRSAIASPSDDPPLPLDEGQPPRVRRYEGDPPGLRCTCHKELVRPGSEVMLWPLPDSEETVVFCELKIPGHLG